MRQRMRMFSAALALAAASLAACATDPAKRDADNLALYSAHAGAPVREFRYFGSISSWTPLGDEALVVWTRPSEAWLLDLSGPCSDLEYAPAIGLTHTFNTVSARFDKVLVHGRSNIQMPCQIAQIRPLDVKALKQARREARENAQASGT